MGMLTSPFWLKLLWVLHLRPRPPTPWCVLRFAGLLHPGVQNQKRWRTRRRGSFKTCQPKCNKTDRYIVSWTESVMKDHAEQYRELLRYAARDRPRACVCTQDHTNIVHVVQVTSWNTIERGTYTDHKFCRHACMQKAWNEVKSVRSLHAGCICTHRLSIYPQAVWCGKHMGICRPGEQ